MKGQILSRIQSYQSIRSKSITKEQEEEGPLKQIKMPNPDTMVKFVNLTKKSNMDSCRISSLGHSTSNKKNKQGILLDPFRKSINRSKIEQIKRSINYEREPCGVWDPASKKYFLLPKKLSHKHFNIHDIKSLYPKQPENEPNRQNTIGYQNQEICSHRSLARIKNIQSSKDLGETKITNRREFMKVFNRKHYSKQYLPTATASSQKNIELDKKNPYEIFNDKKIDKLARTAGAFMKQRKQTPYFQLTHKKIKEISGSPTEKKTEENSENESPIKTNHQDVSIQLSGELNTEQEKLNSIEEEQEFSLSCSRIEQAVLQNDSQFLAESQRELLATMEQMRQRRAKKGGKHWKKLPNDFLKS